jgi:anti-sigma factor RsiW
VSAHVAFEKISAFLDAELPELERLEVQRHLETCAACADLLVQTIAADQAARGTPVQAPEGYFDALPGRIRQRLRASRRRVVPVWGWAVAAALLLAVMTPLLNRDPFATFKQPSAPPAFEEKPQPPATTLPVPAAVPAEPAPVYPLPKPQAPAARAVPSPSPVGPGPTEGRLATRELRERKDADGSVAAEAPAADTASGFAAAPAPAVAPPTTAPPPPPMQEEARPAEKLEEAVAPAEKAAPGLAAGGSLAKARRKRDEEQERSDASKRSMAESRSAPAKSGPVDAARATREDWRRRAAQHPEGTEGDEARFRLVEAGAEAYRVSRDPEDLRVLRRDAAAYLSDADARHAERAREILRSAEER